MIFKTNRKEDDKINNENGKKIETRI